MAKLKNTKTDNIENSDNEIDESGSNNITTQTLETNVETSFFYTSDKFINSLDNDNIIKTI